MRHFGLISIYAIISLLPVAPAISAAPSMPTYLISMEMRDGSEIVAQPRLKFKAGEPARIEVGKADGNHYSMTVTAVPRTTATADVKATIYVVSDGIHRSVSPVLLVTLGERAVIEFGEDSTNHKPLHIDFTLSQAPA